MHLDPSLLGSPEYFNLHKKQTLSRYSAFKRVQAKINQTDQPKAFAVFWLILNPSFYHPVKNFLLLLLIIDLPHAVRPLMVREVSQTPKRDSTRAKSFRARMILKKIAFMPKMPKCRNIKFVARGGGNLA